MIERIETMLDGVPRDGTFDVLLHRFAVRRRGDVFDLVDLLGELTRPMVGAPMRDAAKWLVSAWYVFGWPVAS